MAVTQTYELLLLQVPTLHLDREKPRGAQWVSVNRLKCYLCFHLTPIPLLLVTLEFHRDQTSLMDKHCVVGVVDTSQATAIYLMLEIMIK